jgi:hypothetical protein
MLMTSTFVVLGFAIAHGRLYQGDFLAARALNVCAMSEHLYRAC